MQASVRLRETEHNDRAWLAHTIAGLTRTKRFPALSKLLIKRKRKRVSGPKQTPEQMLAIAAMWVAALGGEDRRKKK